MNRISAKLAAMSFAVALAGGSTASAQAQRVAAPAAASAITMDPALQKMLVALATAMLTNFSASAASGSLDKFDPAPLFESALKGALNSRELNAALDRMIDQGVDAGATAGAAAGAASAPFSPEMRALIKTALKSAAALARNEIARELAP